MSLDMELIERVASGSSKALEDLCESQEQVLEMSEVLIELEAELTEMEYNYYEGDMGPLMARIEYLKEFFE